MLFDFFRKRNSSTVDYSRVGVDIHSHLIPHIDDGAANMETAIQMVRSLKEMGYRKLITTPHIRWDMYRNTPHTIQHGLEKLQNEILKNNIDIELTAAAEYFLDDNFTELLKQKQPLLTLAKNMILVEFSTSCSPYNMQVQLFDLLMAGYNPIIAHPERYTYLHKDTEIFSLLQSNGCMFQLNFLSLTDGYGKMVKAMASSLLQQGIYNFVGTDAHNLNHIARLKSLTITSEFQKYLESEKIMNSTLA